MGTIQFFARVGAALLALVASVSALASKQLQAIRNWTPPGLIPGEVGAITTSYFVRGGGVLIAGSATPATQAQAAQVMKQVAIITFGVLGDAQATFTHNWGLDASAPLFREPEILVDLISVGQQTYMPEITFDRTNTNQVLVNKTGGDSCVVVITLRRPHSVGQ